MAYEHNLHDELVLSWSGPLAVVRLVLLAGVTLLALTAARQYDMHEFVGLRQLRRRDPAASGSALGELRTTGVLGLTRHPWYLAALLNENAPPWGSPRRMRYRLNNLDRP